MNDKQLFEGSCFCGEVHFTVEDKPELQGYCHCESCRKWSAGPVNAFTLWNPESLKVTRGSEHIGTFNKSPTSFRSWCKVCGGHLFTDHPTMGVIDVYAAAIPSHAFKPELHVHYQESVLPIQDGLPKMKDMPAEAGGSGDTLSE